MLQNSYGIQVQVVGAERAAIWQPLSELRYIFLYCPGARHGLSDDDPPAAASAASVAAEAIEQQFAADLTAHYGALGFHYEQASLSEPASRYLTLAGHEAARSYQNQLSHRPVFPCAGFGGSD